MRLRDLRYIILSVSIAVIVIVLLVPTSPKGSREDGEAYFTLAILGEDGNLSRYYPTNDNSVSLLSPLNWSVYVQNKMGGSQYVAVKVKISDNVTQSPISNNCTPSRSEVVYEFRRVLHDNEVWISPFDWSISQAEYHEEGLLINELVFNDYKIVQKLQMESNVNLKIIFELWIFSDIDEEFYFSWDDNGNKLCVWNQLWFDIEM